MSKPKTLRYLSILVFSSLCGLAIPAFSQTEFKDGFIVDANRNYTYGYIAFTQTPHLNCLFKEQKDDTPITYNTGQISGYGVINGNHFRKRPIENFEGNTYPEDIFMEAVVDGPVTLFVAFERMFIERGASFYEIKIEKEKDKQETYRNTLESLLSDCGRAGRKAKNIAMTISAVKTLVLEYNACAASGGTTIPQYAKSKREFGLFAGFDRLAFAITGSAATSLESKNFTDRTLASAGLLYRFTPKWTRHFSFVSGLWFNDQRLYLSEKSTVNGYSRVQNMRINYQTLRLPILFEAGNLLSTKTQPYLKVGISVPVKLKRDVTLDQENESNNIVYIDQYNLSEEFREPSFVHLIAGVSYPLHERISAFGEMLYSKGKNEFNFEPRKTVTGKFSNTGFNVGLVCSF